MATPKKQTDTGFLCVGCGQPIMEETGRSLDGTTEPHLCGECFESLPVAVRVAESRAWRESTARIRCMQKFTDLCGAAMASNALYSLRNRKDLN